MQRQMRSQLLVERAIRKRHESQLLLYGPSAEAGDGAGGASAGGGGGSRPIGGEHVLAALSAGAAGLKALFSRQFSLDDALAQQRAGGLSVLGDEAEAEGAGAAAACFGFLKLAEAAQAEA